MGVDQDGNNVKISVSGEQLAIVAGEQALSLKRRSDQFDAIDASSLAGMLPAIESWRSMPDVGPKKFGETTYLGTMPLAGERPLRDCTVAVSGDLEIRWLMNAETGRPECIEVFADRDSDPAEVWITYDGDDIDTLELRYGVQSVLTVTVNQWAGTAADPS